MIIICMSAVDTLMMKCRKKASVLMLTILRMLYLLKTQTSSNQGQMDNPLKNKAMLKIMKNLTVIR